MFSSPPANSRLILSRFFFFLTFVLTFLLNPPARHTAEAAILSAALPRKLFPFYFHIERRRARACPPPSDPKPSRVGRSVFFRASRPKGFRRIIPVGAQTFLRVHALPVVVYRARPTATFFRRTPARRVLKIRHLFFGFTAGAARIITTERGGAKDASTRVQTY